MKFITLFLVTLFFICSIILLSLHLNETFRFTSSSVEPFSSSTKWVIPSTLIVSTPSLSSLPALDPQLLTPPFSSSLAPSVSSLDLLAVSDRSTEDHRAASLLVRTQAAVDVEPPSSTGLTLYPDPVVLLAPGLVGWLGRHMLTMPPCPVTCRYSDDWDEFARANCVIFHAPNHMGSLPKSKPAGQTWGAFSLEPLCMYPSLETLARHPKIDFEMSYRLNSTVWAPYLSGKPTSLARLLHPVDISSKNATAPVAVMISNCGARNNRLEYLDELMKHIPVHSYGACRRNINHPSNRRDGKSKLLILASYKFYLAFENCNVEDYVSEKLFDGLFAGTLPIYMGAPNARSFLPAPNAALFIDDFESPKALAQHLLYLHQNDQAYAEHMAWRTKPFQPSFIQLTSITQLDSRCRLCIWLHRRPPYSNLHLTNYSLSPIDFQDSN